MKRTESTDMSTILDSEVEQKKNSGFIELTRRHDKSRVLVYPEHNVAIVDDGDVGCTVFFLSWILEVNESYDEVKHLIEEANR